jgi:hypothetical protein
MQRILFGSIALFLRIITAREKKVISTGGLPNMISSGLFGSINFPVYRLPNQFRGFFGEIVITKIPPTTIPGNTEERRNAWLGCKLRGYLLSSNTFLASNLEECLSALENKEYGSFLRKALRNNETLLFEKCFSFRRIKKSPKVGQSQPFGSSLSGLVVKLNK